MSRAGYLLPALRWGQRMKNSSAIDMMVGALTDPFDQVHMGNTAENIAAKWNIGREKQDEFAVESHRRASQAIRNGYFTSQILPIEISSRGKVIVFDTDEHPRDPIDPENYHAYPVFSRRMAQLLPVTLQVSTMGRQLLCFVIPQPQKKIICNPLRA